MQAHPQSSTAAQSSSVSRIHLEHPLTPHPASTASQQRSNIRKTGTASKLTAPSYSIADSVGLAHDAGNLLAALGLYCDLLSVPGVLRPEHRHYATELRLISNRSSELIRGLIATHRTPQQPTEFTTTPTRKRHMARTAEAAAIDHSITLRSLTPILQQIAGKAAKIFVTCPATLPPHDVPPESIERIVVNLVRNATQAIQSRHSATIFHGFPDKSEIRVALAVVAGRLQLTVEDNGPGMPPSSVAAFLQPAPILSGASHGFGHRIVHELVCSSGGQLSIHVRPGNGTVLCIKWPLLPIAFIKSRRLDPPATLTSNTFDSNFGLKGSTTC